MRPNGRPNPTAAERMLARIKFRCQFCGSEDMNKETVTCNNCGTASPGLKAPGKKFKKKEETSVV